MVEQVMTVTGLDLSGLLRNVFEPELVIALRRLQYYAGEDIDFPSEPEAIP